MYDINVIIYNGLGNQLFMIFAALSYSIDNNFKLNLYSYKDKHVINNFTRNTSVYWDNFLDGFSNYIIEVNNDNINLPLFKEPLPEFKFNKIPLLNHSFNLLGLFQSYKYFAHNYDNIIKIMNLDDKQNNIKKEFSYLFNKKTIAIHFRIGDYKNYPDNHNILQLSYYKKAFDLLNQKISNIKENYNILYFCEKEDNDYVNNIINNLNTNNIYNFIKIDDDIPDWKQLLIMSLCDDFIIANSTFSFFGAYFSKNRNKNIIYPSKWLGEKYKDIDTSDLFPIEWIKVDI